MSEVPKQLTPFTAENAAENGAKGGAAKKGSTHLSTRIKRMLDDDDFTTQLVQKDGKKLEFKGNPAEAIIKTAILKAMSGDKLWADWLAQNGYGNKLVHSNDPENPITVAIVDYKDANNTTT